MAKCTRTRVDDDRREIGVLGDQFDHVALLVKTLDRHLVIQPGHDNLAIARFAAAVHGEQVTLQNPGIDASTGRVRATENRHVG
jgi:hypothetical protein